MLDCGSGTVHALSRYGLPWESMTHLFLSHFHVDHVGDLAALLFAFKYGMRSVRTEPLTIVGPEGLDRVVNGLTQAFGENLFRPKFPIIVRMLKPGDRLDLTSNCHLSVAKTLHTEESLAVRIEADGRVLCYTGDTDYDDALAEFFGKADLLISDCSFREHAEGVAHLCVKDAARLASQARVARLLLTHFYFEASEAEIKSLIQADYSGEILIAADGMSTAV
jgi:ribonuclease BN (tRNA processing enzyme)